MLQIYKPPISRWRLSKICAFKGSCPTSSTHLPSLHVFSAGVPNGRAERRLNGQTVGRVGGRPQPTGHLSPPTNRFSSTFQCRHRRWCRTTAFVNATLLQLLSVRKRCGGKWLRPSGTTPADRLLHAKHVRHAHGWRGELCARTVVKSAKKQIRALYVLIPLIWNLFFWLIYT